MDDETEASWVQHCDEPGCGLGGFHYTCPVCNKESVDYEVWCDYEPLAVYCTQAVSVFRCEKCKAPLSAYYDQANYETRVRRRQPADS